MGLSSSAARRAPAAMGSTASTPDTASSRGKSPFASEDTDTSAAELSSETNMSSALLTASDKPRTPDLTPSVLVNGTCNNKMEPKKTMPSLKSMSTRATTAPNNSTTTSPS